MWPEVLQETAIYKNIWTQVELNLIFLEEHFFFFLFVLKATIIRLSPTKAQSNECVAVYKKFLSTNEVTKLLPN